MIFEICTLLQDILDHAVQALDPLPLDQERAVQLAAEEKKARDAMASKLEEEIIDIETQPGDEEDPDKPKLTLSMMQQAQSRSEKRKPRLVGLFGALFTLFKLCLELQLNAYPRAEILTPKFTLGEQVGSKRHRRVQGPAV